MKWRGLYYALLEVSVNKIAMRKNVRVDDLTAELAIIASNVNSVRVDDWTAEWAIITSSVNNDPQKGLMSSNHCDHC